MPTSKRTSSSGEQTSYWMSAPVPSYSPLHKDVAADVCVIGGGIAGLTTAYLLMKEGKSVVVLEDGEIGGGETGRTTGHLSNALDDRYASIEGRHGKAGARLAAQSHSAAIDRIENIVSEENIACDFQRVDGYLFAPSGEDDGVLEDELEAARRAGLEKVDWAARAPFPSFDTGRCLRFPSQAQFHALKYLAGLARALDKGGVKIFTRTKASGIEPGPSTDVTTKSGHRVNCESVVVATNVPFNDRVAIHTKQAAYRSYVIGARVPVNVLPRALYWDTADPYHYLRLQPFDAQNDLVIVGGEDHKTGQETDFEQRYGALESWARERVPALGPIEYRWSGQIIEPIDGLAFIGRNPGDKNIFIVTGDSGNGLTHGTLAAILITDLINERANPWAELYDPCRVNIRAAGAFAKENLNVVPQYADWATPGEIDSVENIAPGAGAVVRRGLTKVAAYRDAQGNLHEYSAVCPHLGCIVRWNNTETTWDCPCHGSRFSKTGEVLNGPASSALKSMASEKEHSVSGGKRTHPPRS